MSDEITAESVAEFDARAAGERIAEIVAQEPEEEEEEAGAEDETAEPAEDEDPAQRAIMHALGEYLAVVQANMPDDIPVRPCHFCHGFGFNPTPALQAPGISRCETCGGIGAVATGSLVAGNETTMCPTCKGTGFHVETAQGTVLAAVDTPAEVKMLTQAEIEQIAAQARARAGVDAA